MFMTFSSGDYSHAKTEPQKGKPTGLVALFLSIHLFQFFASTLAIDQQNFGSMSKSQTSPKWYSFLGLKIRHFMEKILPSQETTLRPNERALANTTKDDISWDISDLGYGWCQTGQYWVTYTFCLS